jgi:hypothetical protein
MLSEIHNHELVSKLAGHLLAGRIKEEEKKRVIDMTKSLALSRNILMDLKKKKQIKFDDHQTSVQYTN